MVSLIFELSCEILYSFTSNARKSNAGIPPPPLTCSRLSGDILKFCSCQPDVGMYRHSHCLSSIAGLTPDSLSGDFNYFAMATRLNKRERKQLWTFCMLTLSKHWALGLRSASQTTSSSVWKALSIQRLSIVIQITNHV